MTDDTTTIAVRLPKATIGWLEGLAAESGTTKEIAASVLTNLFRRSYVGPESKEAPPDQGQA